LAPSQARSLLNFSRAMLCCRHSFEQDSSPNLHRKRQRKATTMPSSHFWAQGSKDSGPRRQSVLANVHNPFYFSNQGQTRSQSQSLCLSLGSPRPSRWLNAISLHNSTSNWGNNTQPPHVSVQPPLGSAQPAVVNTFVWQPSPAPILGCHPGPDTPLKSALLA
jgi:hypothetical protein